ncbi:MAG: MOSC domain-containing protein [Gammaproteobacteria bacterium]|jgi:MOSC domain-containing protein YiiM|nr:MOSC domain-containing protein [Gammaproteobacteria bacterium]
MAERKNPMDRYLPTLGTGVVEWIGVRPHRREPLISVDRVSAVAEYGLEGDHRMSKTPGSGRQVTLISSEFLQQIRQHLGLEDLEPARLRRNIVISGINLNALRRQRFQIGEALLEATQLCHPCARMESELGPGAVVAMFGYGGLCARVISGGVIAIGDSVVHAGQS